MKNLLLSLSLAVLSGCALLPSNRTSTQDARTAAEASAKHSAVISKVVEGVPPANYTIIISGTNNSVVLPAAARYRSDIHVKDRAGVESNSAFEYSETFKTMLPWGISLLLLAAGLGSLYLLYNRMKKSNVAIRALADAAERRAAVGFQQAEQQIAEWQTEVTKRMAVSTNPQENAVNSAELAEVEKAKLKLTELKTAGSPPVPVP